MRRWKASQHRARTRRRRRRRCCCCCCRPSQRHSLARNAAPSLPLHRLTHWKLLRALALRDACHVTCGEWANTGKSWSERAGACKKWRELADLPGFLRSTMRSSRVSMPGEQEGRRQTTEWQATVWCVRVWSVQRRLADLLVSEWREGRERWRLGRLGERVQGRGEQRQPDLRQASCGLTGERVWGGSNVRSSRVKTNAA
jgi:hypothetical protein